MVDSDDGSEYDGDDLHPNSQESSESLLPLVLTTIWDCLGITLDEMVNANGKMIKGWRCGYCPIPGGLGAAPFFKYRNATKALSHLSSKGEDIACCKGRHGHRAGDSTEERRSRTLRYKIVLVPM